MHRSIKPLLALAGVPLPQGLELDGRDLSPLLTGREGAWPERRLFLQSHRGNAPAFEHHFAVVGQRFKLVRASGFGRQEPEAGHPFELYDLEEDPGETQDLAAEHPEVVARLRAEYAAWFTDVSGTRPDNYDPPRIVVGNPAETRTVLTKQDRRSAEGEGWGDDGTWWLAAAAPTELEVLALFQEPATVETARIHAGADVLERSVAATGSEVSLGSFTCPAGPFEFRVELSAAGEPVSVHQLVLRGL